MPNLRRYLLAGLVVTIPVVITIYVLTFLYSILRLRIGVPVQRYLGEHVTGLQVDQPLVAVLTGIVLTVCLLLLVGIISSTVLGRKMVSLGEGLMQRTPLVGRIYMPARQAVQLLFSTQKQAFGRVVMVEYPRPGTWAVGFVTAERSGSPSEKVGRELRNVFLPFSPTPVTGIVLLVPAAEMIELDWTVEQAMKLVISGGVLSPDGDEESGESGWVSG